MAPLLVLYYYLRSAAEWKRSFVGERFAQPTKMPRSRKLTWPGGWICGDVAAIRLLFSGRRCSTNQSMSAIPTGTPPHIHIAYRIAYTPRIPEINSFTASTHRPTQGYADPAGRTYIVDAVCLSLAACNILGTQSVPLTLWPLYNLAASAY